MVLAALLLVAALWVARSAAGWAAEWAAEWAAALGMELVEPSVLSLAKL